MTRGGSALTGAALALGLGAGLYLLARRAENQADSSAESARSYPDNPAPNWGNVTSDETTVADLPASLPAFLYLIRAAEHSPGAASTGAAYGTFYGGGRFYDFSDHPAATGEASGVPLSPAMCQAAGLSPGCVSTAAGAYQITLPTWREVRRAGSWGPALPDFGEASQDEAARRVMILAGALRLLETGDVQGAILRAGRRWASLPGSTARQNPKSMGTALALYETGLRVAA